MALEFRDRLDIGFKVVGVVTVLLGIAIGLVQYGMKIRDDFRKSYYERRMQLYSDVADNVATIIDVAVPVEERQRAEREFWRLYNGRMVLIETRSVEAAMIRFGNCLRNKEDMCPTDAMRLLEGYQLACHLRRALSEMWDIQADPPGEETEVSKRCN